MKKSVVVLIVILILLVLGMGGYLVYDKVLSKDEVKEERVEKKEKLKETKKEIDINSDLVKNLVYPKSNSTIYNTYSDENSGFVLKNDSIELYDLGSRISASINQNDYAKDYVTCYPNENNFSLKSTSDSIRTECRKYPESQIKKDLFKVFGPDTQYSPSDINYNSTYCGYPRYYDADSQSYYSIEACGGAGAISFKPITKTYKAVKEGDYLYIYDYALIRYLASGPEETINLLFDSYNDYENYKNSQQIGYAITQVSNDSEAQSKLEELIKNGTVKTYIWTFKKQSDEKYYYYSSKWQD